MSDQHIDIVTADLTYEEKMAFLRKRLADEKIKEEIELPLLSAPEVQEIPVQVSSQPQESEEKKIIVTQSAPEKPKKRKLKQSGGEDINEQFPSFPQGVAQGAY